MADAARSQRQAALEEKKKRLEELKARRQQRTTNNVSAQDAAKAKIAASSNLDDYIDGLLKVPASLNTVATTNSETVSSLQSQTENGSTGVDSISKQSGPTSSSEKVPSVSTPFQHNAVQMVKTETFEMGTQTAVDDFPSTDDDDAEEDQQPPSAGDESQDPNFTEATKTNELLVEEEISEEAKVLSTEEVEKELSSEAFSSFLNITSKKVERVLGSDLLANLLVDYDGGIDDTDRDSKKVSDGSRFLASRQMYECPKWTASRDVTDMDWSPLHRELMLCGYHMPSSTSSLGQPVGSSAVKVV